MTGMQASLTPYSVPLVLPTATVVLLPNKSNGNTTNPGV